MTETPRNDQHKTIFDKLVLPANNTPDAAQSYVVYPKFPIKLINKKGIFRVYVIQRNFYGREKYCTYSVTHNYYLIERLLNT